MSRTFFVSGLLAAALSAFLLLTPQPARGSGCTFCIGGGLPGTPRPTQPQPTQAATPRPTLTRQPPQGTPTATQCAPAYDPPAVSLSGYSPAYPIVIGQDPDQVGVDVSIRITAGRKSNGCGRGPAQRTISAVSPVEVMLSDASKAWIQNELAVYYPGAHVLDAYPILPNYALSGLGSATVTVAFHLDPRDPGNYDIQITAAQDDGQTTAATLQVPAYLLESTIIR